MKISKWYTLRQHVLVHSGTDEQEGDPVAYISTLSKMCQGMSKGTVGWLAYEMAEKNNAKG